MFRIEIDTDNPAFDGDPKGELARILGKLVEQFREEPFDGVESGNFRDINGSTVGQWQIV